MRRNAQSFRGQDPVVALEGAEREHLAADIGTRHEPVFRHLEAATSVCDDGHKGLVFVDSEVAV